MIVLASGSPRRKELLSLITNDFIVETKDIKEVIEEGMEIERALEKLAYNKALPIFKERLEDIVIGADTIVYLNGEILGKPQDKKDAIRILKLLSGKTHLVITGVSIISKLISKNFHCTTEVEFYSLSEEEIVNYIDECEPYDKAGAYAIQEKAAVFVKNIKGCYYNIMGLPVSRLNKELDAILKLHKE
jgi:septum formation protein